MKQHYEAKERRAHRARVGRFNSILPRVEWVEPRVLLSTYTVNTVADALNSGPGLVSLRLAVADANAHNGADTINFDPNVFTPNLLHTITLLNGQLTFSDKTGATTVAAPGANIVAIDGSSNGNIATTRDLNVAAGATVSINGLRITGGADPNGGPGGGIFNAGTLTLQNSILRDNYAFGLRNLGVQLPAPGMGGGIYSTGLLTILNSTIASNSASGVNGPSRGGGIYSTGPTTIQNSSITSNFADSDSNTGAFGGGIYATAALTIISSVVSSNEAGGGVRSDSYQYPSSDASGGGIYCSGTLTITSSTLQNNTVNGGGDYQVTIGGNARGGAIFAKGSSSKIVSSQITGNTARGGVTGVYGIEGRGYGGGVYAAAPLTISSSAVSGNTAGGGQGQTGYIGAEGGGIYSSASLTLNQSAVSGNTAQGWGGTYDAIDGAEADGGGIFAAGPLTAFQSTIDSNTAAGGGGNNAEPGNFTGAAAGNGGPAQGGGAFAHGALLFTDCTIANNHATGGHGGRGESNGAVPLDPGNGGSAQGGGIDAQSSLQLRDSTVSGNITVGGEGGAGVYDPITTGPGKTGAASAGGALTTVHPRFSNSIISANKAGGSFSDIVGTAQSSSGFNLIGVGGGLTNGVNGNKVGINNPKLSPLANYGGPTQTMRPMAGSPVIDAGSNALIPSGVTTDQRGVPRIFGKSVDIGADEYIVLTLSGSVFNDKNGDGIRQSTDPGLANWQVYIDLNNVGVFVAGDPIATTNSLGNYTLTYLPTSAQSLIIREIRQNNWRRTKPSGIYPLGFYTVSPTAGSAAHLDFGNSTTALITGTVYNDANSNGRKDSAEKGLANFRVYVDLNHDGKFESTELTTLTDGSGNWSLAGLAPGSYTIRVVQAAGWKPTTPAAAAMSLALTSGETLTGILFGEHVI